MYIIIDNINNIGSQPKGEYPYTNKPTFINKCDDI